MRTIFLSTTIIMIAKNRHLPLMVSLSNHGNSSFDGLRMNGHLHFILTQFLVVLLLLVSGYGTGTVEGSSVTRRKFDFIVGSDGDFKAAMAVASKTASAGNRFHMFFPNGEYNIGILTGDNNQMTSFTTSNVSFIGQSADSTVIFNKSVQEGISVTATLHFNKANNLYLQDLTILNRANYGNPATYSTTGRHVAVMEQGNDIIYKNVKLLSTQDTYYTKGNRTYWETGLIEGTTDFICGGGDIFFNECLLFINKDSYLTAPATSTSWGYVFMNCTIDGTVDSYKLGRAWNNSPKCVYINTTMKKQPNAAGWGDPMNVVPSLFAEYDSKTASGSSVNLNSRRTTYSKNGTTVTINPVLTAEQAAKYTVANVMGSWKPDLLARQIGAPVVRQEGTALTWNDNDSALCWAVFRNGKFFKCVTENSCAISSEVAEYTVRAANAMGGLGGGSDAITANDKTGSRRTVSAGRDAGIRLCSRMNKTVSVTLPAGMKQAKLEIVSTAGRLLHCATLTNTHTDLRMDQLPAGMYLARIAFETAGNTGSRSPITRSVMVWQ